MSNNKNYFVKILLLWNKNDNTRAMPWKAEKDPYKIWLSEIILQQTRVEQGWDYYNRFLIAYPVIEKLARAPEKKVFKLWEGLGYYTRCKNLIATAKIIMKQHDGKFPGRYEEILALKGIGPYTAAAIASFAFNLPYAVVDGNVFRVLARFFGISKPIDSTEGKKLFTSLAHELLDKKQPGAYNQAIMDFGAVICKPKIPLCSTCPLKSKCIAYSEDFVAQLPVKKKSMVRRSRWFYYLVIGHEEKIYVRKRGPKDIWENLYEFVLIETPAETTVAKLKAMPLFKELFGKAGIEIISVSGLYLQHLTHQTIQGGFIHIKTKKALQIPGFEAVSPKKLAKLPFPKFITRYLSENEANPLER
ncbi:MAG TPA: A/G-specific adenine glycosylase [Ferruginibacter sp.]|nr:A/G-specific adenine glycosylase [Ferruginibacter sp.]